MNLADYQNLASIAFSVFSIVSAVCAIFWRIARFQAVNDERLKVVAENLDSLRKTNSALAESVTKLKTEVRHREKEIVKLEGALELQRRDMVQVITSMQSATCSLDALWRTLQHLFPDKVPSRASDRV